MTAPRVSVIIVSWNACRVLGPCLRTLWTQEVRGGFETIVVDNASTDETAALLRENGHRLRVIGNDRNLGFSAANNQAAAVARGTVLLFLNSDTELLAPDVLEILATAAEQTDVGVAGPLLLNPDGSTQPSCGAHPGVVRALAVSSGIHRLLPDAVRSRIAPEGWGHDRSIDTGWVMGAAMAMRAEVFHATGGFWSASTMYAEDEELCFKALKLGLRVRFERGARVLHHGNQSNSQRWSDVQRATRIASAELAFLRLHISPGRALAIRAITCAGYAARVVFHGLLGRRDRARVFAAMARAYATAEAPV